MLKRMVSGIMLTLFLIGMLTLTFNIQPVKASGTIYIRADGSVDPSDVPISSVDNITYYFTDNIYEPICVMRDNILLHGAGYTLQGNLLSTSGITLFYTTNVTIKNTRVVGFNIHGIYVLRSNHSIILNNNITNCGQSGIVISGNNNTVANNNVGGISTAHAVYLGYAKENMICNNTLSGILLVEHSSYNSILDNKGLIWLRYSSENTVSGNIAGNSSIVLGRNWGIRLDSSDSNLMLFNEATYNELYGIWLNTCCDSNVILGNNASYNGNAGIYIDKSSNNTFSENIVTNNDESGISVLYDSNFNILCRNTVVNNTRYGVQIVYTNGSILRENSIENSSLGIYVHGQDTKIFHNSFVNNTVQADVYVWIPSNTSWDNGYPSGGNYWSDYAGTDLCSGSYQNETGSDGIGDTPYFIDENNVDRYPFMKESGWEIPTPEQAICDLIDLVQSMNLQQGIDNSLDAKLTAVLHALEALNADQRNDAINKLNAFINEVEAQRGKKLTNEQADYLIAATQEIIDLID